LARIADHLALCAAAIRFLPAADIVLFAGTATAAFSVPTAGFDSFRTLSQRALCARAILRRASGDISRVGWVVFWDAPEPLSDSTAEIA
jgi:hypothetical protein